MQSLGPDAGRCAGCCPQRSSWSSAAALAGHCCPSCPSSQFLSGAKDLQQLGTGWSQGSCGTRGAMESSRALSLPCLRPLTQVTWESPHLRICVMALCPRRQTALGQQSFGLPSPLLPRAQQASCLGGASLPYHETPGYQAWGGAPGKERRAGAGVRCSPGPKPRVLQCCLFYGLGFTGSRFSPVSLQQES